MSVPSSKSASKKGRGTLNASPALFRGEHTVRWFRLYSEAIDDPKVQRLPDHLFKTWVNLLCLTCRNNGFLPVIEDVAFTLRLPLEETANRINVLKECGLIEAVQGLLQPHNWKGRQYKSDVSTDRVKRFRQQDRNVSVTAPDTDTDADTEAEKSKPSSRKSSTDSLFEKAYLQYPRHIGKGAASKAWHKALSRIPFKDRDAEDYIYQRVMHYAEICNRYHKDKQFIPHMATWLNQDRFMDDPSEWAVQNGGNNGNGSAKTTDAGRANRNIQALVLSGMGAGVQRNDVPDGSAVQHRTSGGSAGNRGAGTVAGGEILERKS